MMLCEYVNQQVIINIACIYKKSALHNVCMCIYMYIYSSMTRLYFQIPYLSVLFPNAVENSVLFEIAL